MDLVEIEKRVAEYEQAYEDKRIGFDDYDKAIRFLEKKKGEVSVKPVVVKNKEKKSIRILDAREIMILRKLFDAGIGINEICYITRISAFSVRNQRKLYEKFLVEEREVELFKKHKDEFLHFVKTKEGSD